MNYTKAWCIVYEEFKYDKIDDEVEITIYMYYFRLPEPTPPPFELLPVVAIDSFVISIVAYTVSFSMAKIFAKRHSYKVDATQELYALVWKCFPPCLIRFIKSSAEEIRLNFDVVYVPGQCEIW